MNTLRRQGWRFLLVGGSNTVITFLLFACLAQFINHRIAYTSAFIAGVAYTTTLTGGFVFSATRSRGRTIVFVLWYLGVYLIGLLIVHLIDRNGARPGFVVALATILVTAPLGFLGGRIIYHRSRPIVGADPGTWR